jgi:microcystin-dependent protein
MAAPLKTRTFGGTEGQKAAGEIQGPNPIKNDLDNLFAAVNPNANFKSGEAGGLQENNLHSTLLALIKSIVTINNEQGDADGNLVLEAGTGVEIGVTDGKIQITASGGAAPGNHAITHVKGGTDALSGTLRVNIEGNLKGDVTGNLKGDMAFSPSIGLSSTNTNAAIIELANLIDPLGTLKEHYGTTLPTRHLWANGCTIGDADSGATGRANADTIDLYTVLWNGANITNSQIWLYTSDGIATTKGADAATDFAAHKRLSLPDKRGRTGIGLDNMGGTSANVVTNSNADILGGYDGEENHTLTIAELAAHHHSIYSYASTYGYAYGLGYNTPSGLGGANSGGTTGSGYYNTDSAGHQVVSTTGSGTAHNTMQPWIACNFIMRY